MSTGRDLLTDPPRKMQPKSVGDFSHHDARFWYDSRREGATLYLSASRTFYTFDNLRSIAAKTAYIREHKLRGAYVWALNDDDATATITKAIAEGLE